MRYSGTIFESLCISEAVGSKRTHSSKHTERLICTEVLISRFKRCERYNRSRKARNIHLKMPNLRDQNGPINVSLITLPSQSPAKIQLLITGDNFESSRRVMCSLKVT